MNDLGEKPLMSSKALFWLTAIPIALLYIFTRAQTVTAEDAGELVTAAYTFDVTHPPGYPLWVLIVGPLQHILKGASPAGVASLVSALLSAGALGFLAVFMMRLTRSAKACVLGAWVVGLGHEFWNHATIAEVYALNHFILALLLLRFHIWYENQSLRNLFWVALTLGAGLANHPTFQLFGPFFVVAVLCSAPGLLRSPKAWGLSLLGLALPFLSFLQVYIAAASEPWLSWGCEPTLSGMWSHYTREIYLEASNKTPQTLEKLFVQNKVWWLHMMGEMTLPLLIAGLGGLWFLVKKHRVTGLLIASMVVVGVVGMPLLLNFNLDREDVFTNRVFLMPVYLLLGVGVAFSAKELMRLVPEKKEAVAFSAALIALVALMAVRVPERNRSDDYWAEDFGRSLLASITKDGVLLPGGDNSTFPVLYLQRCLEVRPDVLVLDRCGTLEMEEAAGLVKEELRAKVKSLPRGQIEQALALHSQRPVFFMTRPRDLGGLGLEAVPHGLLWTTVRKGNREEAAQFARSHVQALAEVDLRNENDGVVRGEAADLILNHVYQIRARQAFLEGNPGEAVSLLEQAKACAAGIKESYNNIAALLAEHGQHQRAAEVLNEAIDIRGDYAVAHRNLVSCLLASGKDEKAIAASRRGMAMAAADDALFKAAAGAAFHAKDGNALDEFCKLRIEAVPGDSKPFELRAKWATERENDFEAALAHMKKAAEVSPENEAVKTDLMKAEALVAVDKGLPSPGGVPSMPKGPESALGALLSAPSDSMMGMHHVDSSRGGRPRRNGRKTFSPLMPGGTSPIPASVSIGTPSLPTPQPRGLGGGQ